MVSSDIQQDDRPIVGIAGGSGFVGTHLRQQLSTDYRFRALTRSTTIAEKGAVDCSTDWRLCDLYSLPKVSEALRGCRFALYLVHSMAPSSRLLQGRFSDTDLLLADNFIRAAEEAGVEHVIYLSGLMPEETNDLSPHLKSRFEVESVLRSRSVKVTVLRAGLIIGPGGSSSAMLLRLVKRLPIMLLPRWTRSTTQSIDIDNVCQAFSLCLKDEDLSGGCYDLGGHEPMTYRRMVEKTAILIGRRFRYLPFPGNCLHLSKFWVSLLSGVPSALVGPLLESLRHNLSARPNQLLDQLSADMISFEDSIQRAVEPNGQLYSNPRKQTQMEDCVRLRRLKRVRSVQRMPYVPGLNAQQIAFEYGAWLTQRFAGLLRVHQDARDVIRFVLFGKLVLLVLEPTPYTVRTLRRCAFYVSGGLLARKVEPQGRFEFRLFPENDCMIASIHGFSPTLPWWLYACTQAKVHLWVMHAFRRHLHKLRAGSCAPSKPSYMET
ncbi:MAG: NAD(P)H-binding protein [Coraliomargaritaceae bacterium]